MTWSKKQLLAEVAKARLELALADIAAQKEEPASQVIANAVAAARTHLQRTFSLALSLSQIQHLQRQVRVASVLGNQSMFWHDAINAFLQEEFSVDYWQLHRRYEEERKTYGRETDLPVQWAMRQIQEEQFQPFQTHE